MGSFYKDLEFGNKYEVEYTKIKGFDNAVISKGKNSFYDIITEDGIKYEIKSDRMAHKTGNLCIEFECSNKPSGISITQSDYYGYFIVNDNSYILYTIPTEKIKEEIQKKSYKRTMKGGNGFKSNFYLFDKDVFRGYLDM